MTTIRADAAPVVVDAGDRGCVALLLDLRRALAPLPVGTVVHVRTTDPAAPLDLAAWCHLTGHTWHGPTDLAGPAAYAIEVATGSHTTCAHAPWRLAR